MATFTELKDDIAKWLNRQGMSDISALSEDFLGLTERKTYRNLDLRALEVAVTTDTDTLALPATFLRMKNMWVEDGSTPVLVRGTSMQNVLTEQQKTPTVPQFYTLNGTNIFLGPTPDKTYTLHYVYYSNLTPLSDANPTNWFSTNVPELLLFGSLMEACLYLKDDARAALWASRYDEIAKSLVLQEERQDKEGGSLQVRAH